MATSAEFESKPISGWTVLPFHLGAFVLAVFVFVLGISRLQGFPSVTAQWIWGLLIAAAVIAGALLIVCCRGYFTLAPGAGMVTLLAGEYKGTTRQSGFYWVNPIFKKLRLSLRVRNVVTEKLKVNDIRGNPIEIAAVVVWRIVDTYRATFEVDAYVDFVTIQSESAVRHLASAYPYDSHTDNEKSLRGSMEEVSLALQVELQERLAKAGVIVDEARLMHLAYAPEVAGAMLRRQQADAIVAARYRIVEGAVGMVEAALDHLSKSSAVTLDDERKAAMVSNLMVVLCGDHSVQPVVNTGTLYT